MPGVKPWLVLIRPDRLGDVIVSSAVLKPVLARYGEEFEIVWSVKEVYIPLFAGASGMRVVAIENLRDFLKDCSNARLIFLNPDLSLQRSLSFAGKCYGWGITLPDERKACLIPEVNEVKKLLLAAGFPIGDIGMPWIMPLESSPSGKIPDRPYQVIHISAYRSKPTLTAKAILELSSKIHERAMGVVWVGLDERSDSDWLDGRRAQLCVTALERLTLMELFYVLSNASGVVGRDSGVTHLAAALGIPTVAVVGPLAKKRAKARWSPMGKSVRAIELDVTPRFWESALSFQKRYFASLDVQEALDALEALGAFP